MQVIRSEFVDKGLYEALNLVTRKGDISGSRAGKVKAFTGPVTIEHTHPLRMVSRCPHRNANPFFHYFESLWMLAGQQNATFLDKFVSDFSSRFAEANGNQWGAYGHRWRTRFGADQLLHAVSALTADKNDRRVVIQMWDARRDIPADKKDHPCNLVIVPRVVKDEFLDITVYNRSNDIIWGAFGSNAVHFAMLQQWLASQLGLKVGTYYQVANNLHAYMDVMLNLFLHHNGRWPRDTTVYTDSVRTFEKPVDLTVIDDMVLNFDTYTSPLVPSEITYFEKEYMAMRKMFLEYKAGEVVAYPDIVNVWTEAAREWLGRKSTVELEEPGLG